MAQSKIEWTGKTWNPVTGCTKISEGCRNCYAERLSKRLKGMGNPSYLNGFELTIQPRMLAKPLEWKKPSLIFVNSMSDLFHKDVSLDYIKDVFRVMKQAHWHEFQVLTKRSDRLKQLSAELEWPENVWMGVSVENQAVVNRIDDLRSTGAQTKFLSIEPLIGEIGQLDLEGIDWVIVGGESGTDARPMDASWVRDLRDQCSEASVPFFFKQWGGVNKKVTGRVLDGQTYDEYPSRAYENVSIG